MSTNALHQMTMGYAAEHDRVLFRISTTEGLETQLWLTRRFIKLLWSILITAMEALPRQASEDDRNRAAARAVEHQEALQKVMMNKPHDTEERNKLLTETPLMVVGGKCSVNREGITHIILKIKTGQDITLDLNAELFHGLLHQIITVTSKADWGLDLMITQPDVTVAIPAGKPHLH